MLDDGPIQSDIDNMETDFMKYVVTLEYRLGQINFNAHRLSFPQLRSGGNILWPACADRERYPGIKKITIKIEKLIGRTKVVSRYATVFNALITNMFSVPGPGERESSEAIRFAFDEGSMKFD